MLTRAQEKGIREFHDLDADIARLIRLAKQDLHSGPVIDPGDDLPWPGFAAACEEIRDALSMDLWVDDDGYVSTSAPRDDEDPELWHLVEAHVVRRIILGRDLAEHVQ